MKLLTEKRQITMSNGSFFSRSNDSFFSRSNNLSRVVTRAKPSFTLVELLVVIAIIGILAAVVMIAINPMEMMRKGRDSTRLQDLENVRKAVDMTVAQGGSFSGAVGPLNSQDHGRGCAAGSGWVRNIDLCAHLSTLPVDPTNNSTYRYEFRVNASGNYELRCNLESSDNDYRETGDGGDDNGWYETGTDLTLL